MRSMVEWHRRVGLLIECQTHSHVPLHQLSHAPRLAPPLRSGED